MKNKIAYAIYTVAVIIVILSAYRFYGSAQRRVMQKSVKHLDMATIKMYKEQFNTNKAFGYLWGIKDANKPKDTNQGKSTKSDNNATLHIIQKKNQICIATKCYRFLGIYYKRENAFVSFYSKSFKKGLKGFKLHSILYKTVYIQKIQRNKLVLADKNTTRTWRFQLFDVNVTKYKPKDINETDI